MAKVIDLFYNEIIPEAALGKVKTYFLYGTIFATRLNGEYISKSPYKEKMIPTLEINNKDLFDHLLLEYAKLAYDFYNEEYSNIVSREEDKDYAKNYVKTIMTLLWSNATQEDYHNPIEYLKKRINFLSVSEYPRVEKGTSIGDLVVEAKKDSIVHETPYALKITVNGNELPQVEFGIYGNNAYIYAIQNFSKDERDKKLNRALYKVNEGLEIINDDDPDNLKNVTPATLLSACIAVSYLKNMGFNEIIIPTFLITRWNAKEIMNEAKNKEKNSDKYNETINKNIDIQKNVTDKFIRTFRRLEYHFDNINIIENPYYGDETMKLNIDDNIECNNPLLKEIYNSIVEINISR